MLSVQGKHVADFDSCNDPGDFFFSPPNPAEDGMRRLSFICPCGCGDLAGIRVREDGAHIMPAWGWNRNEEKPTTSPSINISYGHWHGYLTDGVFVSCT
jgi:hypothetical protein